MGCTKKILNLSQKTLSYLTLPPTTDATLTAKAVGDGLDRHRKPCRCSVFLPWSRLYRSPRKPTPVAPLRRRRVVAVCTAATFERRCHLLRTAPLFSLVLGLSFLSTSNPKVFFSNTPHGAIPATEERKIMLNSSLFPISNPNLFYYYFNF